jgi:hypothetical protein
MRHLEAASAEAHVPEDGGKRRLPWQQAVLN